MSYQSYFLSDFLHLGVSSFHRNGVKMVFIWKSFHLIDLLMQMVCFRDWSSGVIGLSMRLICPCKWCSDAILVFHPCDQIPDEIDLSMQLLFPYIWSKFYVIVPPMQLVLYKQLVCPCDRFSLYDWFSHVNGFPLRLIFQRDWSPMKTQSILLCAKT